MKDEIEEQEYNGTFARFVAGRCDECEHRADDHRQHEYNGEVRRVTLEFQVEYEFCPVDRGGIRRRVAASYVVEVGYLPNQTRVGRKY